MKATVIGLLTATVAITAFSSVRAADNKTGIYEVSMINFLPSVLASKSADVPGLIDQLVKDAKADDGLLSIKVTQQVGQPSNYTIVAEWKDQASLDKHASAAHTTQLNDKLDSVITGPVYRRVFRAFQ